MKPVAGRRVAITGLGAVSALGGDVASFWAAAGRGECGIRPIAGLPTERLGVKIAAEVSGFDAAAHFDERRLPLLDRVAQLAVVAAREAVAQADAAGSRDWLADPQRTGVVLAAGIGHQTLDAAYRTLYEDGSNRLHPFSVPRGMPSAPASAISMEFGIRGPSFAVASACSSSAHAIGLAFQMIRGGMLDAALTGGSDAPICVGMVKAWEALRVLSPDGCRPFSKDRNGLVMGEGAGVLVLEAWERAVERGATVLGELIGFGASADAGDLTAPDERGAAQAMQAALDDAGLAADAVDYVNAHGTGTRLNDKTETAALRRVFGERLERLPVSSTKSMIGHCMNAAGALEAVASVLALRDGLLPPTVGWREADADCVPDCVPHVARRMPIEVAMSNSFAFGGLNAVLLLRRAP